jgi:hypothetical protein
MNVTEVVSRLENESTVRRTVVMLNRAFDDEDWQTVRSSLSADFTGTATVQFGQRATIPGADTMLKVMKDIAAQRQAAGIKTMHVLGEMLVTVRGEQAEAFAFQTAYLYRAAEISSPSSKSGTRGTYQLRRESGVWKIVSLDLDRVWLEGEAY